MSQVKGCTSTKHIFYYGTLVDRCHVRATDIPTQCCVCGLQLNSSSHIARSHHHLFPVPNFVELTIQRNQNLPTNEDLNPATPLPSNTYKNQHTPISGEWIAVPFQETNAADKLPFHQVIDEATSFCAGCCASLLPFSNKSLLGISNQTSGTSSVFRCPKCASLFCPECDVFIHEFLHNCPNCQT